MSSFIARCSLIGSALAALLVASHEAHATGAVLPPLGTADPSTVDVELAVAITPFGTTRWSRLTVGGASSVLWLVPARPGAALDWASDAWLAALESVGAPRIAPDTDTPPCGLPPGAERTPAWIATGGRKFPRGVTVHATEADVRAQIASKGFLVSATSSAKIRESYAKGYALVAIELDTDGAIVSTPTLRVSDDGAAILPLALTGNGRTSVRVTATVINEGGASVPGARALAPSMLTWGRDGSDFAATRASVLVKGGGAVWLRESASHEVLFDEVAVPRGEPIAPVITQYFREANGQSRVACESAARTAGAGSGVVGRACATGALARVPGGAACATNVGGIDPAAFGCGPGVDDLALALSGVAVGLATVTRFTGLVPQGTFGSDLAIVASSSPLSPVVLASVYMPCGVDVQPPGGPPIVEPPPGDGQRAYHYNSESGGCGGSTTTLVYDDDGESDVVSEESCGGSTVDHGDPESSSSSSSGESSSSSSSGESSSSSSSGESSSSSSSGESSSSSSSSSSTSSSGWDKSDTTSSDSCGSDSSSSSDSCGSDSSSSSSDSCSSDSSSSSDSCGSDSSSSSDSCGSDSSSSSDSCSSDSSSSDSCGSGSSSSADKCSAATSRGGGKSLRYRKGKRSKSSPVSRYALLLVALVLPLRRRMRAKPL